MGSSPQDFDDRLSRADRWSSVFGLIVAACIGIAAFVFDDPENERLVAGTVGALALVMLAVVWFRSGHSRRPVTQPADLLPWRVGIHEVMYQSWVQADRRKNNVRAPLESVVGPRQDLKLEGDDTWLHDRLHGATNLANGHVIDLNFDDGAGGVWERLEGSYLLVGEAGSGKSVLIWQTLAHLIETYEPDEVTPLLIEAFQWADFDTDSTGSVPLFEDFVAWRLLAPDLGTPPHLAVRLARTVVLLLDGYDELVDHDAVKGRRFLDALGAAREDGRIDRRVMLTTRPERYNDITEQRGSGTRAVEYSVAVKPYPIDKVDTILRDRDMPPQTLLYELERLNGLRSLLQRPLWLSLAIELSKTEPSQPSPFTGMTDPTPEQCEQAIYQAWVSRLGADQTDAWKKHVGYLASRMSTGTPTLTLDQIQGWWLPPRLHTRHKAIYALASGLIVGLGVGLLLSLLVGLDYFLRLGPDDGLVEPMVVRLVGPPVGGLVGGLVGATIVWLLGGTGLRLGADRRFSIREFSVDRGALGRLVANVAVGAATTLALVTVLGEARAAVVVLGGALVFWLVERQLDPGRTRPVGGKRFDFRELSGVERLAGGVVSGAALGLVFGLLSLLDSGSLGELGGGVYIGLLFGVVASLVGAATGGIGVLPVSRQRFDIRGFSRAEGLGVGVVVGVAFSLVFSLVSGLVALLDVRAVNEFAYEVGYLFGIGLVEGLIVGAGVGLVLWLASGLTRCFVAIPASGPPERPASLLLSDFRMKVARWILLGLIGGLASGLVFGPVLGSLLGLVGGLLGALAGGPAVMHHLVARAVALREGLLPFRLGAFLDGLVASGLMYRVGAGYRFRHRMVSHWLADEWLRLP